MKIYFGKATEQELDDFGSEGLIPHNGNYYSGSVEFGSNAGGIEDVVIEDGCNRAIPVSVTNILELCTILCEYANIKTELESAEELKEFVESENNSAHICEHGGIHYEPI